MKLWMSAFSLLWTILLCAEEPATALIEINVADARLEHAPVSVSLENVNLAPSAGKLVLYKISDGHRQAVPSQILPGRVPRLFWIIDQADAGRTLRYELCTGNEQPASNKIKVNIDERKIVLSRDDKNILQYATAQTYPPEGVSEVYKRSAFIHPLWSPAGKILTRIQPPDHWHHYGIWGPWTKTHINGREIDFWNLAKGQGTVRFAGLLSKIEGPVYSGFQVHQEHVDFGALGSDKTVINEVLDIRVWNTLDNMWLLDYTITLNCPQDSILLDAYRYGGGIGFRAAESWTKENVRVLTSAGKTRADADGTFARWCDVSGEDENGVRSGIVFMSHPNNKSHPEPMRVWPLDANRGRGDMFFEFCPIRHKPWQLALGADYVLRYRLLVYDGAIDSARAEQVWQNFAAPPIAKIVLTKK